MTEPESARQPLRALVVGVGSLGQHHARIYSQLPDVRLLGVADLDAHRAAEVARRHHCRAVTDFRELLPETDVASVVVPTGAHFAVARELLSRGISVLLEKPMTRTLAEADELIQLAAQQGALLQIGHIERFNEAIQELKRLEDRPRFIEVHRLGPFSQRNTDIGVVLDLMIHDLDIILDLAGAAVARVDAVGVNVFSEHEDIANVRLTLTNGCVANVTASRVSLEAKRKIRLFSAKSYISIDYSKQELVIYQLKPDRDPDETDFMRLIHRERRVFKRQEPLLAELAAFTESVREGKEPLVTGAQGRQALALALEIRERIWDKGPGPR